MHLRTLGSFELIETTSDGQLVRHLGGQKPLALLAYLAFAPERRASRDRLIALLWGTVEVERARRTLRQTLWVLRQRFGDDALLSEGEDITLALAVTTDVGHFDAAVAAGDLAAAWTLYTGEFVSDFATTGSAGFEHWCDGVRDRLRSVWQRVGRTLVEQRLQAERPREAAEIARRLRDAHPDDVTHWHLELRALLASGDRREAFVVARALERAVVELELEVDAETRALVDRLQREVELGPIAGERRPRPELVGRERAFATLVQLYRTVDRQQVGHLAVVRGSAGIGKSRLLDEFRQRVGHGGGTTVPIRARPVDRDVPFACVAAVAEALAELPGSLGVSAATTAILVDLAPSLSAVYRTAAPRSAAPDDVVRQRTLALVELLACVADESPVVLVIDDLHWADANSRQVLASIADRLAAHRVLMIVATRISGRSWAVPDGTTFVDLGPLAIEHLEAMVASMAAADPSMLRELATLLHEISGGVPMLALAAIDLAIERRLLQIQDGQWSITNPDLLRRTLGQGGVLEKLLADLPTGSLTILAALALCGGPLDDEVVQAVATTGLSVQELATRGLLTRSAVGWELAHDRLADAVLALVSTTEQRRLRQLCGVALIAPAVVSSRMLKLAGRLLQTVDDGMAAQAFRRWLDQEQQTTHWQDPMRAALGFLGDAAVPESARQLAASVRWPLRWWRGYPRAAALLLLTSVGVGGGLASSGALEPPVARVEIRIPESSNGFLFDFATRDSLQWAAEFDLPLTASFLDQRGGTTRRTPKVVRIRMMTERGTVRLEGQTVRSVNAGRVSFPDLRVVGSGVFYLALEASDSVLARTRVLNLVSRHAPDSVARIQVHGGRLNNQPIDSVRRTIRVAPGELLDGTMQLRVTTTAPAAAILVGAVPFWGDRTRDFLALQAVPSHADSIITMRLIDATAEAKVLRAPTAPGRYPLLLIQGEETEMRFIASATNWMLGAPRWRDGNDLVDLPSDKVETLRRFGFADWRWWDAIPGRPVRSYSKTQRLIGTIIDVHVTDEEGR
jgi:DNA-binding SARP family transcriptional activator